MGLYDMFVNEAKTVSVQIKAGPCLLNTYGIGDGVVEDFADGVYHAHEGVVVIHRGKVFSVTEKVPATLPPGLHSFNRWGGFLSVDGETFSAYPTIGNRMTPPGK